MGLTYVPEKGKPFKLKELKEQFRFPEAMCLMRIRHRLYDLLEKLPVEHKSEANEVLDELLNVEMSFYETK